MAIIASDKTTVIITNQLKPNVTVSLHTAIRDAAATSIAPIASMPKVTTVQEALVAMQSIEFVTATPATYHVFTHNRGTLSFSVDVRDTTGAMQLLQPEIIDENSFAIRLDESMNIIVKVRFG